MNYPQSKCKTAPVAAVGEKLGQAYSQDCGRVNFAGGEAALGLRERGMGCRADGAGSLTVSCFRASPPSLLLSRPTLVSLSVRIILALPRGRCYSEPGPLHLPLVSSLVSHMDPYVNTSGRRLSSSPFAASFMGVGKLAQAAASVKLLVRFPNCPSTRAKLAHRVARRAAPPPL